MKYLRKPKHMPLWRVVLLDALVIGVALVIFALFHHVLPKWISEYELQQFLAQQTEPVYEATEQTEPPATDSTGATGEQPAETTEPDLRTEWQKKFADKFTDEVLITENSYSSPEVSVTIETVVEKVNNRQVTYYVADVYVASLENFKTYTAYDQMRYYIAQDGADMAVASNAIYAISGDYFSAQKNGFLVRNGQVYANNRNNNICVLFPDGTMETYDRATYRVEDIMARNPLQVWSFGPVLLDPDGTVRDSYEVSEAISYANPRSAIGYFEPGHYLLVTVDGRQNHSYGLTIPQLAQVFADRGCKAAYNLDGGATAVAMYEGEVISKQSNYRELSDILLITDSYYKAK